MPLLPEINPRVWRAGVVFLFGALGALGASGVLANPQMPSLQAEQRAAPHVGVLPGEIRRLLARSGIPESSLSLYVREFDKAHPLLATHIDTPRNPASVMKLLISFVSLALLGPNHTWRTHILLDGTLREGALHGNLVFQGGGDPLLDKAAFRDALFALRLRGLQHVDGDLLIDNSLFLKETGHPGDFDNNPYRAYNTFPSAALVNFQAHDFHIIPRGKGTLVYADPAASNLRIKNGLRLSNGGCGAIGRRLGFQVTRMSDHTQVRISGNYPRGCGEYILLRAVLPEQDYLFGVFKAIWTEMGGTISGGPQEAHGAVGTTFYTIESRPLREIIGYINKHSNNVMARQLLLTVAGELAPGAPASKDVGAAIITAWLREQGIPTQGLIIDNGAGLSRHSRISTRTLAALLEQARRGPYQAELFASLSVNGLDGTMKKRLTRDMAPGQARLKTGLLKNVRSLAGFVRSRSGRNFIVIVLQNYPGIQNRTGTRIQDALLRWVYAQ